MKTKKLWITACLGSLIFLGACHSWLNISLPPADTHIEPQYIPASPQSAAGNPEKGLEYLIYGDYIGSGIPWDLYQELFGEYTDTLLGREGDNLHVPYSSNVFTASNGVKVVSGNCFTCHATYFNGKLDLRLGQSWSDFTANQKFKVKLLNLKVALTYKKDSPERKAYENLGHFQKALAPHIITEIQGVNAAFRLEEACVAYRNPDDLSYREKPAFRLNGFDIGSDVPPLWNVKKKNALYYNAMGRGDFTKLLMQASVLGIADSTAAREVNTHFRDVISWLNSLEAPPFPGEIDENLARRGKTVYTLTCKKCHGTYGENEEYPNLLVSLSEVKTDPYYAWYFSEQSGLAKWYNQSWFALSSPESRLEPSLGYIAPPLDGIWATAPYLHNGSVPTLDALLYSPDRPVFWRRTGRSDYDYEKVGWKYTVETHAKADWTYNATLPGYGKDGHNFGDHLSPQERKALIEYLKTM
ncbi:MAG: c-type cytochrome [Bacteroidia bacterium]